MKNNTISRYKGIQKGSRMIMRTSLTALLLAAVAVMAATESDESRLSQIQSQMNSIINKAGIDFSGTFRAEYFASALDESSGEGAVNWGNNRTETNEYTSVDFDIKARPNEALSARVIFRMHQNWQNFFSDLSNPIFSRWLSIDANIDNMFRFNVGDFRQKYSPLTLWSPDIDIAYEPEIFAAKRQEALNEVFIGNNDRLLQGINFNMDAEVVDLFNEFHLNVMATRLRCGGTMFGNGSAVTDKFEEAEMDRILFGTNLDLTMLKGLGVGGSYLYVRDLPTTYNGNVHKGDSFSRKGAIGAFRLKPSSKIFMEEDVFTAGLEFEIALSSNRDTAWYDKDSVTVPGTVDTNGIFDSSFGMGKAINIDLVGRVALGELGKLKFKVGFMNNDSIFRNEMAQSPTFLGQRIMNVENDGNSELLYTTFDALYNHVFKFVPNTSNQWSKDPRQKISYVTGLVTIDELETVASKSTTDFFMLYDPALQTVLPYGPATPNRVGPKGEFNLQLFDGGVDAGVDFAMLQEAKASLDTMGNEKAKFSKLGFGICVDVAKWAEVLNTMKLSFGMSKQDMSLAIMGIDVKNNNTFTNIGFYYNFWQRFSLLAGYQQIVNEIVAGATIKTTQSQWAAGLEYKVSPTSKVIGRYGAIGVKNEEALKDLDFTATQSELFLNVDF